MYEKRFGLHRKPFQSVLTDHDFFQSETIHEILPAVLHALKSDLGVAVLTGPSGVGKSVTLEHLRRSLESSCQTVLIRGGTVHCAADLLFLLQRKLLKCQTQEADLSNATSSNVVRRWEVVERLERIVSFWGPLIVLLDDAHLVQPEVFAELRALLEEDSAGQKLLRLLIAGPLLLEEVLAEPNRVDFVQKIRTHVFLQPLRSTEAVAYLNHQLTCAGASLTDVMDSAAVERIVVAADGIPRCLNLLADESLMVCDENEVNRVSRAIVDQALERLQHLPYAWNVSLHETHEDDSIETDDLDLRASAVTTASSSQLTSKGVTEAGVFEIGESSSPTQSRHITSPATVPTLQKSRDAVTMEGSVGCIEIGALTDTRQTPLIEKPPAESESAETSCNTVDELETVTTIDQTATDELDSVSESDLNADSSDALPSQTDQTLDGLDSVWTATEVTAEEFFQHQETLAEFDDSDDAISWKPSSELPLVEHTLHTFDAMDEQHLFASNEQQEVTENQTTQEVSSGVLNQDSDFSDFEPHQDFADERHEFVLQGSQDVDTDEQVLTTDSISDGAPEFAAFQLWQPAGTWPAATVARPVAVEAEPIAANVVPVFDRYTWCELGRTVSSSQWSRKRTSLPVMASSQWPPLTHGIAPAERVPVIDLQDDYAELLTDLGILIEATSDRDGETRVASAVTDDAFLPGSDQIDSYAREHDHNPETALDRIQQLLESERHESQPTSTAAPTATQASASDAQNAPKQNSDSEQSNDAEEGNLLSFASGDAESRDWTLVDDSRDQTASGPLSFLNEIFDAAQRPHPSTFDADEFSAEGPPDSDNTPPSRDARNSSGSRKDVSQDDAYPLYLNRVICDDDRDVSLLSEGQIQNEDEETQQQQYLPQLLRQARQRVATRSVHGGQLRHAAGAESVSTVTDSAEAKTEAASPKPRLSISSVHDEEEEQQVASGTAESAASALNFRNLFTRLRQRDKQA